jgi:hypothetical protein
MCERQISTAVSINYRLKSLDDWEMHCACPVFGGQHTANGSFFSRAAAEQRCYWPYALVLAV